MTRAGSVRVACRARSWRRWKQPTPTWAQGWLRSKTQRAVARMNSPRRWWPCVIPPALLRLRYVAAHDVDELSTLFDGKSDQPLIPLARRRTGVKSPVSWPAAPRGPAAPGAGARTPERLAGPPGAAAPASAGPGLAGWCPGGLGRL